MIVHVREGADSALLAKMIQTFDATDLNINGTRVLVLSGKVKEIDNEFASIVDEQFVMETDLQLASRSYHRETREVALGSVSIGGTTNNTVFISGPCSIESREQIVEVAERLVKLGITIMRAGCFKPRTSPYSFMGLGPKGLDLLVETCQAFGLSVITEVRDSTHVDEVIEKADIIQIGAKAMYDHGILKACGACTKPVLLKRGFGTTLQEFVQAAEFILSGGNPNVMLCERGIRTFETHTRFTLDLCGVAYLKEYTNLPVILDPSHAMGYSYGVPDLTRACTAMGVDGLLIEAHPNPKEAKSDAAQQLTLDELEDLLATLGPVASAVGRTIV